MSRKSFSSGLSIKPLLLQGNSPLPKTADINRRHAELDRINGSLTANASDVDSEDEREEGQRIPRRRGCLEGSNEKLKEALSRIRGDVAAEGGFKFFRHQRREREFDEVDWECGVVEGVWRVVFLGEWVLIVVEEMKNELLEFGYGRYMMALNKEHPPEIDLWFLEHGIHLTLTF